jgi:hypothetical protein
MKIKFTISGIPNIDTYFIQALKIISRVLKEKKLIALFRDIRKYLYIAVKAYEV